MDIGTIIIIIVVGVLLILVFYAIGVYNNLINARNKAKDQFSQIDVQLKRRSDMIPNLVETVKAVSYTHLFYDYETGPASYKAPSGIIKGNIIKKRQYIIEDAELKHIFDNDLNISDSLLQEVLAEESSDKMKNIVNTCLLYTSIKHYRLENKENYIINIVIFFYL